MWAGPAAHPVLLRDVVNSDTTARDIKESLREGLGGEPYKWLSPLVHRGKRVGDGEEDAKVQECGIPHEANLFCVRVARCTGMCARGERLSRAAWYTGAHMVAQTSGSRNPAGELAHAVPPSTCAQPRARMCLRRGRRIQRESL